MDNHRRRTILRTAGIALTGAIAGCSGGESTDDETTDDETTDVESDETEQPAETSTTTADDGTQSPPSVDEFLAETSNYESIEDRTGTDSVEVQVGTEANGANFGFSPPAIRIDQGTSVTWVWTGNGGIHNVVARYGADFRSEQTDESGHTVTESFDESGTVLYVCDPHEGTGMKGAIVVE
ncbi:halocyanin domain-containing protein [Salinibaculum salinum]|uniref:halocyanin domain-containing protein n=1 Tax=Salinibaculum salinum TaxID=3131996 RepID=UPI0030EF706A